MNIDKIYKILKERLKERELECKERDKIWESARQRLEETAKAFKITNE